MHFVAGISQNKNRKILFKKKTLTFERAFTLAVTLPEGHKDASAYVPSATADVRRINLNAVSDELVNDESNYVAAG